MKDSSLYRLEVAPLVILPLSRSPYFSYTSSEPTQKGSLISISFGRQTLEGVVFDCQKLPGRKPHWMKAISSVLQERLLTETQCALAEEISEEYFTPLGKVLKHFVPKVAKERKKKLQEKQKKLLLKATREESKILRKFKDSKKDKPLSVDTSTFPDPKKLLLLFTKETYKTREQTLILVPEITLIAPLLASCEKFFDRDKVAVLHSKLSAGAFFAAWERIRSGEARIIIGTRQALFAPFFRLGLVIVTEEQDESYKQWDMSPKYHTKRVATFLSSLFSAKLVIASPTPSTETLLALQEKRMTSLGSIAVHSPLQNLSFVNLKLERYRKNFSPLSETLKQELGNTLRHNGQALLYINRQGMNAFSVCENCKNVFRCKKCDHPLATTKDGHFRCTSCGFTTSLFPSCPSCGHLHFRHIGFGTEKVEKEVQKLFPGASVKRFDSTTLTSGKVSENLYSDGILGKIDILIGTQMVLKDPPLPRLSLVAIIDADSLLVFPDFSADEKLYQSLSRASRQVALSPSKPISSGTVMVQTFHPEGAFFGKATSLSSEEFFRHTLAEREELFYPPFSRALLCTTTGTTEKEATEKGKSFSSELQLLLPKHFRVAQLSGVRSLKRKGLYESRILLRFPHTEVLPEKVVSFLKKKSKDIMIDVDPLSLR
jgi:primosomal protein N' (replication factor Y)